MKDTTLFFHKLSYLQYPLMLIGLYFSCHPLFSDLNSIWNLIWVDLNKTLIFFGLGISLSSLQDTSKTQNKLSRKVFENPKRSRIFLFVLSGYILFLMILGLCWMFLAETKALNELSFGVISLAIGLVGLLKSAIEMAEKHQKAVTAPNE
ncbi:MAG TPA: hypothetical protein VIT44_01440 [Cyclobacteriaceae bacterium]